VTESGPPARRPGSVDFVLPVEIEDIELISGSAAIAATGNNANNSLAKSECQRADRSGGSDTFWRHWRGRAQGG
jgi:hypothetical protein